MSTPNADIYPTITYRDPLVMPQFIRTNDWGSIRNQVHGDWLLASFITKLNQEIVDDIEEWKDYKQTVLEIFNAKRVYGWCVFQSYDEFDKVFTPHEWVSWITQTNKKTKKLEKIGMNVKWVDDLNNSWDDEVYFEDHENKNKQIIGKAHMMKWKDGNGLALLNCPSDSRFALPDLDLSVLSLAIQIRQIQNTLTFASTNPFFYHLVYGNSILSKQRLNLVHQMSYVDSSRGIGVKESILKEIIPIENGSIEKCQGALDTLISFYSATTRLPLSFYFGEKKIGSGLDSGGAENEDTERLMRKKEYILQNCAADLTEIASEVWGITLPDLYGFYQVKREEAELENKKPDLELRKQELREKDFEYRSNRSKSKEQGDNSNGKSNNKDE